MRYLAIFTSVLLFLGCGGGGGGEGGSENACSALGIKVFGGAECGGSGVNNPVVALITVDSNEEPLAICTGTLVTVDDILTAAHCFEDPRIARVVAAVSGAAVDVAGWEINPLYGGETGSPFDVAVATLVQPQGISPVPILVSRDIADGDKISVYGYGQSESRPFGPLNAAQMVIGAIEGGLFAAAFDQTSTSICQGDSGGPVVEQLNGVAGIVGISSFTFNGCSEGSISGFVDMQIRGNIDFVRGVAPDIALR